MNVCIYLRKSRAEENISVEEVLNKHKTTLLAYAQKYNYNILDIKEEIISGESITRRPKMLELLREVEDNKYDAVLVMDIDRLGRGNMREQGLIFETFKEYNTKIITPNKIYDLDNEFDEEYSEFEAFMARRELKIIKKRLQRGRMKSLEQGNYISPYAPYGYDRDVVNKTLTINKEQANIIKLIFDLYVNKGYGDTKIANYLKENKICNKHGNTNWDKTTIRKIIQNPVYIGKIVWNKRKYKYLDNGNRTSSFRNKKDWTIFEGKHKPIIDEKTFYKAQELTKERYVPHLHTDRQLKNPLAGIVKCGVCGATMTMRSHKNKPNILRCYKGCRDVKSSYLYLVEERVLSITVKELEKIKFNFEYENNNRLSNTELNVLKDAIKTKNKQLDTLKLQKEKLYDLLEQGIYDNDTFLNRMNTLSQKITTVNNDITKLDRKIIEIQNRENMKSNIIPEINNSIKFIKTLYSELNPEQKNEFLKSIIDKVVYNKDKDADNNGFKLDVFLKI